MAISGPSPIPHIQIQDISKRVGESGVLEIKLGDQVVQVKVTKATFGGSGYSGGFSTDQMRAIERLCYRAMRDQQLTRDLFAPDFQRCHIEAKPPTDVLVTVTKTNQTYQKTISPLAYQEVSPLAQEDSKYGNGDGNPPLPKNPPPSQAASQTARASSTPAARASLSPVSAASAEEHIGPKISSAPAAPSSFIDRAAGVDIEVVVDIGEDLATIDLAPFKPAESGAPPQTPPPVQHPVRNDEKGTLPREPKDDPHGVLSDLRWYSDPSPSREKEAKSRGEGSIDESEIELQQMESELQRTLRNMPEPAHQRGTTPLIQNTDSLFFDLRDVDEKDESDEQTPLITSRASTGTLARSVDEPVEVEGKYRDAQNTSAPQKQPKEAEEKAVAADLVDVTEALLGGEKPKPKEKPVGEQLREGWEEFKQTSQKCAKEFVEFLEKPLATTTLYMNEDTKVIEGARPFKGKSFIGEFQRSVLGSRKFEDINTFEKGVYLVGTFVLSQIVTRVMYAVAGAIEIIKATAKVILIYPVLKEAYHIVKVLHHLRTHGELTAFQAAGKGTRLILKSVFTPIRMVYTTLGVIIHKGKEDLRPQDNTKLNQLNKWLIQKGKAFNILLEDLRRNADNETRIKTKGGAGIGWGKRVASGVAVLLGRVAFDIGGLVKDATLGTLNLLPFLGNIDTVSNIVSGYVVEKELTILEKLAEAEKQALSQPLRKPRQKRKTT